MHTLTEQDQVMHTTQVKIKLFYKLTWFISGYVTKYILSKSSLRSWSLFYNSCWDKN